ncbi:uncharacterized protein [Anabrus simplex]|uniref:uncharacterized protein n=1 Tax=Anabrus simplex TaxID=316456 RepID=UPI0034DD3839
MEALKGSYIPYQSMPVHKVKLLYHLCLENIILNADFWLQVKKVQEKDRNTSGPFDDLPASIEQDLLDAYERLDSGPGRKNMWLERQDRWRLFVTQRVNRLSVTDRTEKCSLAHIAATCKNVKYLEVKNVHDVIPYLKALAPCLSTVVSLNFETMAHVNSAVLKYIRSHCPNLRVLGLRSCFLNDKAVGHLKHINSLTELDLRDTEVTAAGVCRVLKHNPQLCSLQHPDVVRALYKMHATTAKTWLVRAVAVSYRLHDVELELSRKDGPEMLAVVAEVCPAVERVRVEFDVRASPQSLAPLARLQRLAELDIQCVGDDRQSEPMTLFRGSIVPILEARGQCLLTMSLEGVADVDMRLIEVYCPRLVSLGLYYNSYIQDSFHIPKDISSVKPFPALRRLLFGSNSGNNDFPSAYLEWLLANKDLEELCLSGSPLFTNELFSGAFANSCAFPHLRRLELDYCNISQEVITDFLCHCGRKSLKELSICGPFVHEQATPALCYIICKRLDVQLEAYFYSFVKMKKRMVRYKQDLNFINSKACLRSFEDCDVHKTSEPI